LEIYRYGYGYGLSGSTSIYIAAAILLIYVAVALVHIAFMVGVGWSSFAWTRPTELIALAVNSTPSRLLQNTCAGIEDRKIWTHILSVKETTEAHLEIVFEEEKRMVVEEMGAEGQSMELEEGQMDEFGEKLRRRVVPRRKYGALD
jgi:hypothetical protein